MKDGKARYRWQSLACHPLYLALISLGTTVNSASAQVAEAPAPEKATAIQGVTVTGPSTVDERRNETTSKIIVSREDILRHNDTNLSGVMRRLPGITVSPTDGIRMRGLGAGYTQILVDGDPVPADFSIDSIAPDLIERIEILPSAVAEFSARSIAGTINIVLRKSAPSAQRTLKFSVGKEGGDWYPNLTLLISDKAEDFSYSVSGNAAKNDDRSKSLIVDRIFDSQGDMTVMRNTDETFLMRTETFNVSPRLNWTFAAGDTLSWQSLVQRSDEEWTRDRRETAPIGGPSEFPHNQWISDSRSLTGRSDLSWKHNVGENGTLSAKLGVNYLKRDTDFSFLGFNAADVFVLDRYVVSNAADTTYTTTGKYLMSMGATHSLGFGWDGSYTRRTEERLQHDRTPQGAILDIIDEEYAANVRRLALYAQDEWTLTPRLQAYSGIRWEGLDTSVSGRTIEPAGNSSSVFSPIMQILWKLPDREKDQIRFSIARTYRAPAPRQLVPRRYTVNNNNSSTNPDVQGNPNLRPEIAWGADIAYEYYFGASGMLSLSVYARSIDDVTIQRLFQEDDIWISMPVNSGKATTRGVAFETKFPLKTLFDGAPDLDFRANLARNWSTVDNVPGPRNRLASQTPFSASIGLDYRPSDQFSIGADYSYQSDSESRVSAAWTTSSGPERTLDIYMLWNVSDRSLVRVSISNALHQDSELRNFYEDSTGSSSRSYVSGTNTGVKLLFEHKL